MERSLGYHPVFSMAPGRGPLDAAWRQPSRGEALAIEGHRIIAVLWGLKQFYEHMSRSRLRGVAFEAQYPMLVMQCSINSRKWPRRIALGGIISIGFSRAEE